MEVKDRVIAIEETNDSNGKVDCSIIDEYGIKDAKIYHRRITINENVYETFEKNPDENILLDGFLQLNGINLKWEPYDLVIPSGEQVEDEATHFSRLFIDIELEQTLSQGTELSTHRKSAIYKQIYNILFNKETLIENPLALDVFNEALRIDPESAIWESVFPFFR